MRRITVNASEVALIHKRGTLVRVLREGRHWIGWNKRVSRFQLTEPLCIEPNMVHWLEHDQLKSMLRVVRIADHEIGLEMIDGLFGRVLEPGKIAYWDSPMKYAVRIVDTALVEMTDEIPGSILLRPELKPYLLTYTVGMGYQGLLYADGKFVRMLEPGVYHYWKSDKVATVVQVDKRVHTISVAGQEILTRDKAGIRINFSAQHQVVDVVKAVVDNHDYIAQLYTALQLVLREYIGSMTLDQLLSNKQAVGQYIVDEIEQAASQLGVRILSGGIKDIILPGDVKDIMNQVLIAQKKAQANTIMRQEETASTRSLLNTAKLMEDNAMLLKLKEMEYMEKIADKIGEITVNGGSQVMDQLRDLVLAK